MEFKFFPRTEWRVESEYRKEYILQMVGETIGRKSWRSSLYNANNEFPASGVVKEDGFTINFSNLEKKSRSSLRVPLTVKMSREGNLTMMDCKVEMSNGKIFGGIMFYVFFGVLSYLMGFSKGDVAGAIGILAIVMVQYWLTMFLFNREMLVYKSYVKQLSAEVGRR